MTDYDKKIKFIVNEIDNLSDVEFQEIFRIVHTNNYSYTRNTNGIFINISKLNKLDIDQLYAYISFCKESKKNMIDFENIKNNLVKNSIYISKDSLNAENISIEVNDSENNKCCPTPKNKVSTTMKFYILKKKMLRLQSTINYLLPNILMKDEPLIV